MDKKQHTNAADADATVSEILFSDGGRARFEVAVEGSLFRTLLANKDAFRAVMEQFGDAIRTSAERGDVGGFSVVVDPTGSSTIRALDDLGSVLTDRPTLAAARARGRLAAANVLGQPDMVSSDQLGRILDLSRMTINTRRSKREILGLNSAKRGYRFPVWQFDELGRAFAELPRLFELLGDEPWAVYRFLVQRHSVLGGVSAREALHAGRGDDVLAAADALQAGTFA